ncbi:MAG: formamidopyrimidine-DNA glycosylase [Actinobacteria bacterium]|nr:formamidopyrimidine-DNA glycosylase [Actinomycetota bacterium]
MPELPEVEAYRRLAAERALGREIVAVEAPDAWYLKGGLGAGELAEALVGRCFSAARRIGKLLVLETVLAGPTGAPTPVSSEAWGPDPTPAVPPGPTGAGPALGLRFGMTGRLVVDGWVGVGELLYSSNRAEPAWDRFAVRFADGGDLRMRDPRRLGGVVLDPNEAALGVDAAGVTVAGLRRALGASVAPLKARLMDQARVAGVGNLIADEALWRAALDPRRPAASLTDAELRRLQKHLRSSVADLIERGGSHSGDLHPHRHAGGRCPKDGATLARATVGGRTTWWCPTHQR